MSFSGRLLLDTQVFIWWRANSPLLGRDARAAIASADLAFVSVASAWEAAVKIALGKLRLPESFEAGVLASRFERLPIRFPHAEAVASLPRHHHDPFDRMLVVQCQSEGLALVTHNRHLAAYGVESSGHEDHGCSIARALGWIAGRGSRCPQALLKGIDG